MIDAAATLHCDPQVTLRTRTHTINGKTILEVEVPKSAAIPVKARDEHGRWKAYFRQKDQNFMADRVILQVWRRCGKTRGLLLKFEETENLLLNHLRSVGEISVSGFRTLAGINSRRAEKILSDFILCGLITYEGNEMGIFYRLSDEFGAGK